MSSSIFRARAPKGAKPYCSCNVFYYYFYYFFFIIIIIILTARRAIFEVVAMRNFLIPYARFVR